MATRCVVFDHSDGLHHCVHRGWPHKTKTTQAKFFAQGRGLLGDSKPAEIGLRTLVLFGLKTPNQVADAFAIRLHLQDDICILDSAQNLGSISDDSDV